MDTKELQPPTYSAAVGETSLPQQQQEGTFTPYETKSAEAFAPQNVVPPSYSQPLIPPNPGAGNVTLNPVVVVQPQIMRFTNLSTHGVMCPTCNTSVSTVTETKYRSEAYVWCCVLFCFASPLCSCVPFAMQSMKETIHYCQRCRTKLGYYRPQTSCQTQGLLVFLLLLGMGISILVVVLRIQSMQNDYSYYG